MGVRVPKCERVTSGEIRKDCPGRCNSEGANGQGGREDALEFWASAVDERHPDAKGEQSPEGGRPGCLPFLRREESRGVTTGGQGIRREAECSRRVGARKAKPQERTAGETNRQKARVEVKPREV
jgi:hypothetical protein